MSETLGLVSLGSANCYGLEDLKGELTQRFRGYVVRVINPLDTPTTAFDSLRKQYHSTRILVILEEYAQSAGVGHLLGVASFDLYVPGMNFVFGEARCPGRAAVISTYRLSAGSSDVSELLRSRVVKEAVHEIGHMLGLKHCSEASCVMHFSERLADTDRKEADFCSECEHKMRWVEVE